MAKLIKNTEASEPKPPNQFGIAALFWATFIVGLGLSYLQRLKSPDIMIDAVFAIVIATIIGGSIGLATKKVKDALFWSTLIAAFAYISTASDPIFGSYHRMVWTVIGALAGGLAATVSPNKVWLNGLTCAVAAWLIMGSYYLLTKNSTLSTNLKIDLWMAPFIGICISAFVKVILWLESQQSMPRYITATWLMVAVIVGNLASP